MILYFLICMMSVLVGCGILTLLRVDLGARSTLCLAPVATLCFLCLAMGGLLAGGFTVGQVTPGLYIVLSGLAVAGAVRSGKILVASWGTFLLLAALPLVILVPDIVQGMENYYGGLCKDGWSYVNAAQSLQQYPLGWEGWLSPGDQFSSSLGSTRFITYSLLALLAPLGGWLNDTQQVFGHYVGWLFFVYGSACLLLAKAMRLNRPLTWAFLLLTMLSGWNLKLIDANSVDNTLALCFLPTVIALLLMMPAPSIRYGIGLGTIVAAGLYGYPESSAFTVAALLAVAGQRMISPPLQFRQFARMGIAVGIAACVCILPRAPETLHYFVRQVSAVASGVGLRPGEGFFLLLSTHGHVMPGFWGLTPDFALQTYAGRYDGLAATVAYILTAVAMVGMFAIIRRGQWSLAIFGLSMTAAYAFALVHMKYPYAAYKILTLSWFVLAYASVAAVRWAWETFGPRSSKWAVLGATGASVALLSGVLVLFFVQERVFYKSLPFKSLRDIKKVVKLENVASGQPVALIVNDEQFHIWGVHFLRKTKLYLANQYRGYMLDARSLMDRSNIVDPADIRYVVTDDERSFSVRNLLSKEGPYYIWDFGREPWLLVTERINPFGLEPGTAAEPCFWIAKTYAELHILSRTSTTAVISADFTFPTGAGQQTSQSIHITTEGGYQQDGVIANGFHSLAVPLKPGLNRVLVRSTEKKPVPVRATHLSVSPQSDSAQINDLENPNGIETVEAEPPFFWLGPHNASVTIFAAAAGIVHLTATLQPGPSLVDKSEARLSIISPAGIKVEVERNWGATTIDVPVRPGMNTMTLSAAGPSLPGGVTNDPRIMMIGFRNLAVSSLEETSNKTEIGRTKN